MKPRFVSSMQAVFWTQLTVLFKRHLTATQLTAVYPTRCPFSIRHIFCPSPSPCFLHADEIFPVNCTGCISMQLRRTRINLCRADVWFVTPYPSCCCFVFEFIVTISGVQPRSVKLNANDMDRVTL